MVRKSTQLELDEFREMFMPEEAAKMTDLHEAILF